VLAIAAAIFLASSLVRGMIAAPEIARRVDALWPGGDDQPLRFGRLNPHRVDRTRCNTRTSAALTERRCAPTCTAVHRERVPSRS
jgi:hypothetical protein